MKHPFRILVSLAFGLSAACSPGPEGAASEAARAAPKARPVFEVPIGTSLAVVMDTAVSSKTSQPGDRIEAHLASDLLVNGRVVARAGTAVRGQVTAATPSGRVKTRARLAFVFDNIAVGGGGGQAIETRAVDVTADDSHGRDAVTIGGGAGAGAIIGAITGGKKGAGIGALIGAGAGTGVVLIDKGKNIQISAGASLSVELTRALRVTM